MNELKNIKAEVHPDTVMMGHTVLWDIMKQREELYAKEDFTDEDLSLIHISFTSDEAILPTRGGDWDDGCFWQGLYLHDWGIENDAIQATWEYLYKVVMLSSRKSPCWDA